MRSLRLAIVGGGPRAVVGVVCRGRPPRVGAGDNQVVIHVDADMRSTERGR